MQDLPPLFDRKGVFCPFAAECIASLSPERQLLYRAVAEAAENLERAEADLKSATEHVTACVRALADAEKAMPPRMSFHDLWKQTFGHSRERVPRVPIG